MNETNYQPCSICHKLADDGGLYEGKFTCHDCLDQLHDKPKKDDNEGGGYTV